MPPAQRLFSSHTVLQETERLPVGPERQLEILREGSREDLGVVDGDAVLQRVSVARQMFGGAKRIGVPAALGRIRVVVIVQDPRLEVDGLDDECVSVPPAD